MRGFRPDRFTCERPLMRLSGPEYIEALQLGQGVGSWPTGWEQLDGMSYRCCGTDNPEEFGAHLMTHRGKLPANTDDLVMRAVAEMVGDPTYRLVVMDLGSRWDVLQFRSDDGVQTVEVLGRA